MSSLQYEAIPTYTKWWETEQPDIVETNKNVLKFFPKAKKLQVSRPNWTNDYGEVRPGKTVTLDLADPQAVALMQRIVDTTV